VRFHALTGDLPPRISVWKMPELANDPYARAFGEQLRRVRATPKVPEWERIATDLKLVAEKAAHGELTADQTVAELDKRADEALAKRRWILARQKQASLLRTEERS